MSLEYIKRKYNLNHYEISNVDRVDLVRLFAELKFKVIVEVGVCAGAYTKIICTYNPEAKVYGIDPFIPYEEYRDYKLKSTIDDYYEKAKNVAKEMGNLTLIRKFSMDALEDFPDESIDAVYIDANHEEPFISDDIREWTKKVKKGGIVSGHDYVRPANNHRVKVKQAVDRYVEENNKTLILWGLEAKVPGLRRESARSWMFTK